MKTKYLICTILFSINLAAFAQNYTVPLTVTTNTDYPLTFNNTDNSWQYIQFKRSGTRKFWMGLDAGNNFKFTKEGGGDFLFAGGNFKLTDSNLLGSFVSTNAYSWIDIKNNQGGASLGYNNDFFWIGTGGAPADGFTIQGNNIGMGTAAPVAKLDIKHTGTIGAKFLPSKAYLRLGDGTVDMIMDGNEIYTNGVLALGSSYSQGIIFRNVDASGRQDLMMINHNGNVGIGTNTPSSKLQVEGNAQVSNDLVVLNNIDAKSVEVSTDPGSFPDYVFKSDYKLRSLDELQTFIKQNGHLPNIPKAEYVETNGQNLGFIQQKLLEKIEELTLYIIEADKQNSKLKSSLESLTKRLEALEKGISKSKN